MKKACLFVIIAVMLIAVTTTVINLARQGEKTEEGKGSKSSHSDRLDQRAHSRQKRDAANQWNLPFKDQARLTDEQQIALNDNPKKALAQAIANKENPLHLIVEWAGQDPDAAMRWVDLNADSLSYGMADLLGAVAAGHLIHGGPDAMMKFIQQHNQDSRLLPKAQGVLDRYAFRLLGRSDTIGIGLKMLQESKDGILAGYLIGGIDGSNKKMAAIDYMEAKNLKPTLNYWALQDSASKDPQLWADWALRRNSDLLPELIQSWARDDGKAARVWMESELMKDDPRLDEIRSLIN